MWLDAKIADYFFRDILNELTKLREDNVKIMSAITDWAAKEEADLTTISSTLDVIVTGIAALDKQIADLQAVSTTLSAADQAALDSIKAASADLVSKAAAISTAPPPA